MYHDYIQHKICEGKAWLKQLEHNMRQFESLVGKQWLTDSNIDAVFRVINKMHDNTISFVCTPTPVSYTHLTLPTIYSV